jgi:hypothetical protein
MSVGDCRNRVQGVTVIVQTTVSWSDGEHGKWVLYSNPCPWVGDHFRADGECCHSIELNNCSRQLEAKIGLPFKSCPERSYSGLGINLSISYTRKLGFESVEVMKIN